jgi:hypothetical protein
MRGSEVTGAAGHVLLVDTLAPPLSSPFCLDCYKVRCFLRHYRRKSIRQTNHGLKSSRLSQNKPSLFFSRLFQVFGYSNGKVSNTPLKLLCSHIGYFYIFLKLYMTWSQFYLHFKIRFVLKHILWNIFNCI